MNHGKTTLKNNDVKHFNLSFLGVRNFFHAVSSNCTLFFMQCISNSCLSPSNGAAIFFADVVETTIININYGEFEVFGFFCRTRPNPVPALMKKPRVLGV